MKRSRLIVLSGEAGAGKDSLAQLLCKEYGWELFSLAAPLKRFAGDMFGFTDEQLYGPSSARNAPDSRWARPCQRCKATGLRPAAVGPVIVQNRTTCEDCEGTGKINDNSPRRVLQLLGEEYLRQMIHVDALTMHARPKLELLLAAGHSIVVNDARNDNDRNNMHDWLGACRVDVRTGRVSKKTEKWREHVSENRKATDDQLEYIVQNDEEWPFPSLPAKMDAMLKVLYG